MAVDIGKCLFRTMAGEGLVLTRDHFRSLEVPYIRLAEDTINRYYADVILNGLRFDRHSEELAVATFAISLRETACAALHSQRDLAGTRYAARARRRKRAA